MCNTHGSSCKPRCSGKTLSITYSVCMLVALSIQHAKGMLFYLLWPLRLYRICLHYLTNGKIFGRNVTKYKMCVLIFSARFV
jgi:hypothetical protein